jgi:hypothetical protein
MDEECWRLMEERDLELEWLIDLEEGLVWPACSTSVFLFGLGGFNEDWVCFLVVMFGGGRALAVDVEAA